MQQGSHPTRLSYQCFTIWWSWKIRPSWIVWTITDQILWRIIAVWLARFQKISLRSNGSLYLSNAGFFAPTRAICIYVIPTCIHYSAVIDILGEFIPQKTTCLLICQYMLEHIYNHGRSVRIRAISQKQLC